LNFTHNDPSERAVLREIQVTVRQSMNKCVKNGFVSTHHKKSP